LIDDAVIVEIKAIEAVLPIHEAQLLTYVKLSRRRLGLLLNFNTSLLKDGMKRIVL
jgi:GxxExxY protein